MSKLEILPQGTNKVDLNSKVAEVRFHSGTIINGAMLTTVSAGKGYELVRDRDGVVITKDGKSTLIPWAAVMLARLA